MSTHNATIEFVPLARADDVSSFDFRVARFPVTVEQYSHFIEAGGYRRKELWSERGWEWCQQLGVEQPTYWGEEGYKGGKLPVTGISFWEAEAFANFADARLPNEAEWRWMASNGGETRFPWGDSMDEGLANLAFFGVYAPSERVPVDSLPGGRSRSDVWDLIGNVSEWCLPGDDSVLDSSCASAVLRGGCCWHTPVAVDCDFRDEVALTTRDNQTGIRLVRGSFGQLPAPVSSDGPASEGESPSVVAFARPLSRPTRPFRQEGLPESWSPESWRLEITGAVRRPLSLSLGELRSEFPSSEDEGMFVCVCGWAELNTFKGISVRSLLDAVETDEPLAELYLRQISIPGENGEIYDSYLSIADLLTHDALLALEMDGKPLSLELGGALRLIDFHLYGYKTVKSLGTIQIVREFELGWWEKEKQYDPQGTIRPGVVTVVGSQPYRRVIDQPGRVELTEDERQALRQRKKGFNDV